MLLTVGITVIFIGALLLFFTERKKLGRAILFSGLGFAICSRSEWAIKIPPGEVMSLFAFGCCVMIVGASIALGAEKSRTGTVIALIGLVITEFNKLS